MAPAAIALEGAVQRNVFDRAIEAIVLDDDAATPREVPAAATVAISIADATSDTGSRDDIGPPTDGVQPTPRMRGEADEVFELVGTLSCPAEASTLSKVDRRHLLVSLLSMVRMEPEAYHQDESC
jgi:hypothetical protein